MSGWGRDGERFTSTDREGLFEWDKEVDKDDRNYVREQTGRV